MHNPSNKKTLSAYVLIIGSILTILAPLMAHYLFPSGIFAQLGEAGDAIGGISAPVASLVGSILIYFALSDQLEANRLLSEQIQDAKVQGEIMHDQEHVAELFHFFEKSIDTFSLELRDQDPLTGRWHVSTIQGLAAIAHFVDGFADSTEDQHDAASTLSQRGAREYYSILKTAELLCERLRHSRLSSEDRNFYKNLLLHRIQYSLSPEFEAQQNSVPCPICGQFHGSFPAFLHQTLEDLKMQIAAM